ncbi:PE domain-containing protein [Pseudonocardia sp. HH130630-07]|uniref:PE domain-containing protein n=1 Tax=Pseudonocardia sp. HH130630-07 TaxID=1690815 RepID=UPI0018D3749F|nr:PE domain-containing protein [Pseudonocardia sp. HH130630-07]
MAQITPDNVLAVRNELRFHAEKIREAIRAPGIENGFTPCGGDVVSVAAAESFNAKIGQIRDVHLAHAEELQDAAQRLEQAAREYGHTDDYIRDSFTDARPALQERLDGVRATYPART